MDSNDDQDDATGPAQERSHGLVQATVPPLDEDGLTGAIIGTAAFLVAFVACWIKLDALRAAGYGDWLWICLTGAVLGIVGVLYIRRRRRKLGAES
ncbi:DUF2530 domain-containing protein [Acidipropionibacterium virtanenii]|uniref:DUF2530 domain-containing protein n=1 Tax=Acidipropionibacterium virtanenii TaxID=2057246 RepID=A0A344UW98_9ACTN|nr:DUF2530 domain-containing protein [Acidipropionibacterium virtanenii]AXE39546.1 hypothetical protein JS278_02407 [Acidipropionibacterium virtanenii]